MPDASLVQRSRVMPLTERSISVRSMAEVPGTLEFFMGKNTPKRRQYIMENLV